ncbi:hypothetical protein SAY87_003871 [Trapa incisa]|uniref:Uncharacterized protein n=1 Tax=Trapa incisa TaxID=236973 RepID=A0AAN7KS41_9MYRT|nr:hypothetical protein SAY87_003871 [Trapa incisa]
MHRIEYEGGSHSYTLSSTRISNELGAGNTHQAKKAIAVTLKLSVILAITFVLALSFGHNLWASLFSESRTIIDNFASLTPFLAISITLDSIAGVLSGLARGCGWQHLIVYVNMTSFYLIGMPAAILLGFKFELDAKAMAGLWIGLICGIFYQALALLIMTLRSRWRITKAFHPSFPRSGESMLSSDNSTALLEHSVAGGGDDAAIGSWWWWRFDAAEAKGQVQFSLPMILTNVFYYSIRLVSVMLAGHIGEMELASATLANTWTAVTGFAIMLPSPTLAQSC